MDSRQTVLFREEQPWRATLAGPLLLIAGLSLIGIFGYALYSQLVCDRPFGGRPAPDGVLAFFGILMILIGAGLIWLVAGGKLVAEVRADALYVRHYPLTRRHRYPYDSIAEVYARTYRPILEYGGWGVRGGRPGKGKAYNVSGNRGVQLVFTDGKKLLIGSQTADALAQAIEEARKSCTAATQTRTP